jgi:hypothetical protein
MLPVVPHPALVAAPAFRLPAAGTRGFAASLSSAIRTAPHVRATFRFATLGRLTTIGLTHATSTERQASLEPGRTLPYPQGNR